VNTSETIFRVLQPILGLPENCTHVEIILDINSAAIIKTTSIDISSPPDIAKVLAEYELVKKE